MITMAPHQNQFLLFIGVSLVLLSSYATANNSFNRSAFPDDFIFGASAAAYQYEGEANKSGRGPSVWDIFTHEYPEKITDRSNGDEAIDFYHRYKEDIQRMKNMNLDAFRFSISWTRIIPNGQISAGVNQEGIDFYNDLIDELISNGLEPFVTIFHWDSPQGLEDKYTGFLSRSIVKDFQDFAELCYKTFGDRVKYWTTFNEPRAYATRGYDSGLGAPGRCSEWVDRSCEAGNSATEPYIVSHHIILAHAAAVQVYRQKYQASQNGKIGITLNAYWYVPYSNNTVDEEAAQVAFDFFTGWHLDPITYGHYPRTMQALVGDRLPKFTEEEFMVIKGSYDFLGLNYYGAYYAYFNDHPDPNPLHKRYTTDSHVNTTGKRDGKPMGPQGTTSMFNIYPEGIRYLLNYTKDAYRNPTMYITENGYNQDDNGTVPMSILLNDTRRIIYYETHLENVLRSIKEYNVDVKGFIAWSFEDNFEWSSGYTQRFGLYYIDYKNHLERHAKNSTEWFTNFLQKNQSSTISEGSGSRWIRPFGYSIRSAAA
uniref:Glycoside hydrolase family 1 n=1 Tax=Putranjiva roxburghii TaxID=28504 RepID=A0A023MIF8_9ROSI|nr:glycoside hydrolase family 1 [Putranjiva roxburghii]